MNNSILSVGCSKEGVFVGINLLAAFNHITKGDPIVTGIALFSLSVLGSSLMRGGEQPKGLNKPCEPIKEEPVSGRKRSSLDLKAALLGKPSNVTSRFITRKESKQIVISKKEELATIYEGSNESTNRSEEEIIPTGSYSSFLFVDKLNPLLSKIAKFALSNPFASSGEVEDEFSDEEILLPSSEEIATPENITAIKSKKMGNCDKLGGYEVTSSMRGHIALMVKKLNEDVLAKRQVKG